MASFQQRGKSWQYTISHKSLDKPIRKGGFRTKAEAKIAAAEEEAKLNKGITPYLKPEPFDEYFDKWVNLYKNHLSTATLKHYRYTYDRIKEYFVTTHLQDISTQDYQMFLNQLGLNRSKETVEKVNGHIRACVRDAVDEYIIPRDFTRKAVLKYTVLPKKDNEKHLNFYDAKSLLKKLLINLNIDLGYYLLLLGLVTGLRFEELVGLTLKNFDFENNILTVNKTWGYNNRMKKGFGPTKNYQSNRKITVNEKTMVLFKNLFETTPDTPNHLVFYNPRSKYKVISNEHANELLKKVLLDLKIRPLITMHGLRHTHGSMLLYQKADIQYVSERLGHGDIETTYRVYLHLLKESREANDKLVIKTFEELFDD
ncbi:site-specific integrase [Heyndrickxia oleronia]|uniref:site-specific integrase n=1 Tax=Heyndrickxia oleronia TaxID=38875 RepID=UPI00203C38BE|nr:site-specific integrase [Heyndrickxia oleronia]MCM3239606.1 site-specific integrase [Heyndrickxia oleronia]